MTYPGFSKLQSDDHDIFEDDVPPAASQLKLTSRRRSRSFTRFELGLIITLVLFATALATYTVVYIVQHRGSIRPAAVAALSCVALLLLAIACSIYQRIRRPNWFRDVESGSNGGGVKKWTISAPIPISISPAQTNMSEVTLQSKAPTYTSLSTTTTLMSSTLLSPKGRLQKKYQPTEKKESHNRFAFWLSTSSSFKRRADKEYYEHLISSSARSSSEISEVGYQPDTEQINKRSRSLWRSVFELPGEDPSQPPSRPSTPELPAGEDLQIILTKPEPSLSRDRIQSSSLDDIAALRQSSVLTIDPLRSNPFLLQQLKRDPSVRLSRSSHDLGSVRVSVTPPPPSSSPSGFSAPRRPRSAEPGPDRARLGYDLAAVQLQIDRAVETTEVEWTEGRVKPRVIQTRPPRQESGLCSSSRPRPEQRDRGRQQQQQQSRSQTQSNLNPRALRRAKSPVIENDAESGRDLRKVYQEQLGK